MLVVQASDLWYPRYAQTYIDRDVRSIRNITDLAGFQRFVRLCAGRIGQLLNFTSLATEAGVDTKTAQAWIGVLEASYLVFVLRPHHRNFNKRIVKQPKLYFCDTGLACSLLGITDARQVESHYLRGGLFENLVILEFLKQRLNRALPANVWFWRNHVGNEVDLLLKEGANLRPVEIKSGATITAEYTSKIKYFCRVSGTPPQDAMLIYGGDRPTKSGDLDLFQRGQGEVAKVAQNQIHRAGPAKTAWLRMEQ